MLSAPCCTHAVSHSPGSRIWGQTLRKGPPQPEGGHTSYTSQHWTREKTRQHCYSNISKDAHAHPLGAWRAHKHMQNWGHSSYFSLHQSTPSTLTIWTLRWVLTVGSFSLQQGPSARDRHRYICLECQDMHHMLPRIHLDLVSLNTYTDGVTLHTCPFTKRGVDDFTHWTIMLLSWTYFQSTRLKSIKTIIS